MESSPASPDSNRGQGGAGEMGFSRRYGNRLAPSSLVHALLEYSGVLRERANQSENESLVVGAMRDGQIGDASPPSGSGEVAIRIISVEDQERLRMGPNQAQHLAAGSYQVVSPGGNGDSRELFTVLSERLGRDGVNEIGVGDVDSSSALPDAMSSNSGQSTDGEANTPTANVRDSANQRYNIQPIARWIEHILPFSLLLLVVFIRQHLQGFFITIWIATVLFKSNDILRKQTALKGERKIPILVGIALAFTIHLLGVYWWCRNDDLLYPFIMLAPKEIPPFWQALFIIMVNDTMARQAAMVVKCVLLMYFKNSRGPKYRKQCVPCNTENCAASSHKEARELAQRMLASARVLSKHMVDIWLRSHMDSGLRLRHWDDMEVVHEQELGGDGNQQEDRGQMLTLVEYLLLLYRGLLPAPVWYRFFLNKEYGSIFSSLITGLYLTFKLTSIVEKVQSFVAAVKALSRKEVHYGSYATMEQVDLNCQNVVASGDLCTICQEKLHIPILLSCNHIFCEDCVSEWPNEPHMHLSAVLCTWLALALWLPHERCIACLVWSSPGPGFERERTCPLCRAVVKPADIRSFADGSTSLFFQLF
ncbi:hypothetical protein ZIOFF_027542 [Zingiber officinale]|uniref:RING-type domain-containing protein n=1 Tax=Zingiber officinale TaxID=94328 RepID=A0A8J5L8D9_ZINOF|nr:hypothetical protein ZIOFF_027542 [Zingiber officinale]